MRSAAPTPAPAAASNCSKKAGNEGPDRPDPCLMMRRCSADTRILLESLTSTASHEDTKRTKDHEEDSVQRDFVIFVFLLDFVIDRHPRCRGNAAVSLTAVVTAAPQRAPARSASSIVPPRRRTAM